MSKQRIKRWVCLAIGAVLLSLVAPAVGEQASIETLLDKGTTIESIQSGNINGFYYAQAVLKKDGQNAVAVFLLTDGSWTLQAESPWFPTESYSVISLKGVDDNSFYIRFDAADGSLAGSYGFKQTDEGWLAVCFEGENLRWCQKENGSVFEFSNDSEDESWPFYWGMMLTDVVFPRMPQTVEEMRAFLLTDDVARITLAQYATVPLRQQPTAEASYTCVLIDGAILRVLDRQDGWAQVALDDQITGWVPVTTLEIGNKGYRFHYSSEMIAMLIGSITLTA